MNQKAVLDVFLSFNQRDKGLAHFVVDALSEKGLNVFELDNLEPGVSIQKRIREKLVECSSVVILVTPTSIETQHLAFEAGMAMAWSKPIFVLYDGVSASEIPEFLTQFQVTPVSSIANVADVILKSKSRLSDEETDVLGRIYAENRVPVDALILQPNALSDLTQEFKSLTGHDVGGERIARELLRLRKAGKLPKLQSTHHPA